MAKPVDCAYTISGDGPALFMIHGIGARRTAWDRISERLTGRFTCIRYDLRGHGDSPLPDELITLDHLVADLEALRAQLEIDQAHVIGHSLGGMIGPAYARAHPDRVLSLGLLSTAAFRTEEDGAKVKGVVADMRASGIGPALDVLTARWFTDGFADANEKAIERRKKQVLDTPADVFLNVFDVYAETEMAPWLHEITAASLVLTGELDGGCNPRLNRQIADALPNSSLVILENLKHAIMIEAPDRVADALLEFYDKNDVTVFCG